MAGKYQRPQIMPPKPADMASVQAMGKYMEKHTRRVNDALAEVYRLLSAMQESREQTKEAGENG